jgi:HEAT repeat protein
MNQRWREVVLAGYRHDADLARAALDDADPTVRSLALGALERLGMLSPADLSRSFTDPQPAVRRRAVLLAARHPSVDLLPVLDDGDPTVVELAAWACGEHEVVDDAVLSRLIVLAGSSDVALVREACVAALGAIGDERGLPAILAGCGDQPAVRRRAVLALAPFDGEQVDAAIAAALSDRDWQVRQAAEDLRRATGD